MKSIKTIRLYSYDIKTLLVPLIFVLFLIANTIQAQSNDFIDDGEIQMVAYPEGTDNPAWDAVKDFTVPSALEGRFIDFTVQGGDGSLWHECMSYNGCDRDDQNGGGEGVTITMRVGIGSGPNEIPVGSTIRMILGQKGDEDWKGAGGTGLAFRRPFAVPGESRWVILAVAGGGGGGSRQNTARPGRADTAGYWGRGTATNANNGFGGEDGRSNDDDYAKGGRGYLNSLSDFHEIGEPVGSFGRGGGTFGFGGGGAPVTNSNGTAGGGGGGYSGGGGGKLTNFHAGGGGGSWINEDYAISSSMTENGTTTNPDHGYIEYLLVCPLTVTAEAEITDIVTLYDNDCDPTFGSVWLNFMTDPQSLDYSCNSNLTYAIYRHDTNNWVYNDYANGNIEKGVKTTIFVTYNDVSLSQKTFVFPEFEWRDETEISLTTNSTIIVDAQDLVNLTGTSTPLIQNFNFQFLNADGSIAEGEQKTFTAGSYTQNIGLISFAGTIICQYEMTVHIKAPEIDVNNCTSGITELIENINPVWYRFNGHHTQWQSFSPEGSGLMESLYFELVPDTFDGFEIPQNAILNIHRGEGTSGELIYTKNLSGTLGAFNTITIDETLYLEEDQTYTFAITDPTTTNWGLTFYVNDFYPRGRHFIWNDRDVAFRVNIAEACDEDTGIVSTYMEDTEVGTTNSKTFTISNTGTNALTISSITTSNALFTIGTHSSSISEGDSTTFEVNFTPTSEGVHQTTITIMSNDLNMPSYSFDITGKGIVPLQLSCKDNLIFTLDENGSLELGFDNIVNVVEGTYTSSTINGLSSLEFNGCNTIGDYPITLEISTSGGTSMTCNTTVRVNPQVTYPDLEDITLYFNRGGALPTYDYDVSAFVADCPEFLGAIQIAGLPSGSQFPAGTTTNTFEISNNDISMSYSFDVTVVENPIETLINLEEGELDISDWNTITDDDQITLSISGDGNTLYISNLNGSVQLLGSALSYEGDTGSVVAVPMSAITNGIKFNGRDGNNGITIEDDLTLSGAGNGLIINDISNYTQLGVLDIEGDFSITGDADIVIPNSTFDGTVSLQGNTIDIKAIEGLTLAAITATGTATTDMNYVYSYGDILLSSPVQTAGDSNLTIRGNIVQQASDGIITTNELILEGNSFETSGFILDVADNNINKLSSNTTDHRTSGILFKDLDAVELGIIDTGAIYFTADTFTLTESTNLTFSFDSLLAGGINQTATNSSSPARINHNGGKLRMYGATPYTFTGAFQYTAVAGTTTQITSTAVLIDTPNHEQTFGQLDMFFESFTVAAGSIVNVLNKGEFESSGTVLEGNGIVNGNIDIVTQASLDPGTDAVAGNLTINGDLKLYTTSINSNNFPIFKPFIESDVSYDVLNLTGTLELDNVKFEPTGDPTITDGMQEIVLIQNDGTDPIIGTFHGLPQGATFILGNFAGLIDYEGGDGNDVSLRTDNSIAFMTTWQTDNPGTSNDKTISIPTSSGETYDYVVDWGDGTIERITTDASPSHTYATAGEVTVKIFGTFPRIQFNNSFGDRQKITEVVQWGNIQWSSMESAFLGCTNLDVTAMDSPDLTNVTSMQKMFRGCTSLIGTTAFDDWNVANVEDMIQLFASASQFNINISNWNVSSVQFMTNMFDSASIFNQPIGNWNTENVTHMGGMFSGAEAFNQDLNNWDVSSVEIMAALFADATNFNGNITSWNTNAVTDMLSMFSGAEAFNQDISGWNTSNVYRMFNMFRGAADFNQPIGIWNVSGVLIMRNMFSDALAFNQDLSNWDVSSVSHMGSMFNGAEDFDQDLSNWNIEGLSTASFMFTDSGLSNANYDNLLIGWATLDTAAGETLIPSNINFSGGDSQYCAAEAKRQELIDTYGWSITDNGLDPTCPTDILVAPKVYLQGASINPISGEESLMRDDLRVNGMFPLSSPYSDGSIIDASVLITSGSDAIVDWVWVELRDQTDNSMVIDGQSALLQRDGDVVGVDGISPLAFAQSEDRYYVVINHRNHIGVITAAAQTLNTSTSLLDLTSDPAVVEGGTNSVLLLPNGFYGMYTGDFDGNAQIQNSDASAVIQLIGGSGYEYGDMDVNTQIQNTDVNALINPNIGRGEQFGRPGIAAELLSSDVTVAFTNAEITNDGMDDYYEADIVISGTTDFYIGSGQVYLEYNTAAFGENVATNNSIAYSQPDGSILGYSFGAFSPAYRDFVQNDNTTSRVSLSFQQNIGLAGLETAPELQITSTPKVLFHIKIRYVDINADADICFYSEGVFQDQFFTACGGTATADCTNTPGVQITNDTYDCSEAGVGTLSITSLESEQILLYPNPTSSSFSIKGLTTTSQIRIYDVNGRLILEEQRSDDRVIDMSRYDNGVYLVEISNERGTQIKRLIKK
ncbi:BspA family leucine-rich repeat surface protein [Winogradskyella sp.]|uniref:BspA family leucine-rich repeat surface protein n=1 Tax=Winogradskyella sp. TaxID=1883156 RepID=UPI003BA88F69